MIIRTGHRKAIYTPDPLLSTVAVGSPVSITPSFAWPGATYTCSDPVHWNSGTNTWTFTPAFADGGTIKTVVFTCSGISQTATVVIFRNWSGLVKYSGNPTIPEGTAAWDINGADTSFVRQEYKIGGTYYSITAGLVGGDWKNLNLYTSTDLLTWAPYAGNPVLTATETWEANFIIHPAMVKIGSTWCMLYGANAHQGVIALATTTDWIHWTKQGVVYAGNPAGTGKAAIPSVILGPDGLYYMHYWNMDLSGGRVAEQEYATSPDCRTWTYGGVSLSRSVGDWDYGASHSGYDPFVTRNAAGFYEQVYSCMTAGSKQILGYCISANCQKWYKYQAQLLAGTGNPSDWDGVDLGDGCFFFTDNRAYLFYGASSPTTCLGGVGWIDSP